MTKKLALESCRKAICEALVRDGLVNYDPIDGKISRPRSSIFRERKCQNAASSSPADVSPTNSTSSYYEIQAAAVLSYPYQTSLEPGQQAFLYSYSFPLPNELAKLCGVPENCFTHTHQSIGFLFSRKLSEHDLVCRVPLYLKCGMHRVSFRLIKCISGLSEDQVNLVKRCHKVLSFFSLEHDKGQLPFGETAKSSCAEPEEKINLFDDLQYTPSQSRINGLFTIHDSALSDGIDFNSLEALSAWSDSLTHHMRSTSSEFESLVDVTFSQSVGSCSGILSRCDVRLTQLPLYEWTGRLVRPLNLRPSEAGNFLVCCMKQESDLTPSANVDPEMAIKINSDGSPISFHQYFFTKYPNLRKACPSPSRVLEKNSEVPLAFTHRFSRNTGATYVMSGHTPKSAEHVTQRGKCFYLPYAVQVHALPAWLWFQINIAPHFLFQLERCMKAAQLEIYLLQSLYDQRPLMDVTIPTGKIFMPDRLQGRQMQLTDEAESKLLCDVPHIGYTPIDLEVNERIRQVDPTFQTKLILPEKRLVPKADMLLAPITHINVRDMTNYERLEWLGDVIIYFCSTIVLYSKLAPGTNESRLSRERSRLVSNKHMINLMHSLNLTRFITGYAFTLKGHYVPPGFVVKSPNETDTRCYQQLRDKTMADCFESLLACILHFSGVQTCARFLNWTGYAALELPKNISSDPLLTSAMRDQVFNQWEQQISNDIRWPDILLGPKLCLDPEAHLFKNRETFPLPDPQSLNEVQQILQYNFKNQAILVQALNHPTCQDCSFWGDYQRLEFLGDAVLAFYMTQRTYEENNTFTPGELTALKTAVVKNLNLASVAIKFGLHKYLRGEKLPSDLEKFARIREQFGHSFEDLDETPYAGISCKIYGDLLESIIGAVYIDCGASSSIITSLLNLLLDESYSMFARALSNDPFKGLMEKFPDLKIV
ncbi:hypothetical protein Ciccas_003762 [Cichlidogyrus casuarinus]|uniref:RNase III domain-containing protein n=1 Tax=Cichlidogyrus casuarinus TaxID=1844966 RepID=A0ABD2QE91_9PLAT